MAYIVDLDRNQTRMITTSLDDLIDEDNAVRVIDAYVEALDLHISEVCILHLVKRQFLLKCLTFFMKSEKYQEMPSLLMVQRLKRMRTNIPLFGKKQLQKISKNRWTNWHLFSKNVKNFTVLKLFIRTE